MSGLFQRFKGRKAAPNHTDHSEPEPTASSYAFDEEGFLCPVCHHKCNSHVDLEQHYKQTHATGTVEVSEVTSVVKNEKAKQNQETLENQFAVAEQSRLLLNHEFKAQKQHAEDLEQEIELLKVHLKTTQEKAAEQSLEIANLRALKDVHHAQLTTTTDELRNAQIQLQEKHDQFESLRRDLLRRPSPDDVDALKRELAAIQQGMNEVSLKKEKEIEKLRSVLVSNYKNTQRFNQIEKTLNQNSLLYDETVAKSFSQIVFGMNQIRQFVKSTRKRKENIQMNIKNMRARLMENQAQIKQLQTTNIQMTHDLQQRAQFSEKLKMDLQQEQKQTNLYRAHVETLSNDIRQLETTLSELRNEKNQLIQTRIDADDDSERQNMIRQITEEKNQHEQQIQELRLQIKQLNVEKQQIQDQLNKSCQQNSQITYEKSQLQNEQAQLHQQINLLQKQTEDNNRDKERRISELNSELLNQQKDNISIDENLHKANDSIENQRREIVRLQTELTEQRSRSECEMDEFKKLITQRDQTDTEVKTRVITLQKQNESLEQQIQTKQQTIDILQTTLSQLYIKIDQKEDQIQRISTGIRRSIDLAQKTCKHIQQNVQNNQMTLLSIIEQAEQETGSIRAKILEQIREEFNSYLNIINKIITDSKVKFKTEVEKDHSKLLECQRDNEGKINKLKDDYAKLMKELDDKKRQHEMQVNELNKSLTQASESLSSVSQSVETERKKYEKQISSLESDLEARAKRHQMQITALSENLASVRSELRAVNGKISSAEQIKAEKADLEARLVVSQDERHVLLERSLLSESNNEKLRSEKNQLSKKVTELESKLRELNLEHQALQIQKDKLVQRRWIDDDDIHACMKCNQSFSVTQRKHHCRHCGNIFCDTCSSKTAIIAASSKKPKRVCEQCFKELTA